MLKTILCLDLECSCLLYFHLNRSLPVFRHLAMYKSAKMRFFDNPDLCYFVAVYLSPIRLVVLGSSRVHLTLTQTIGGHDPRNDGNIADKQDAEWYEIPERSRYPVPLFGEEVSVTLRQNTRR